MPKLSKKEQRLIDVAFRGGGDSLIPVLNAVNEIEDEVVKLDSKIEEVKKELRAELPDLNKVLESIKGKDGQDSVVPGPQGEKGDAGESIVGLQGERGPQGLVGPKGDSVIGPQGKDGEDAVIDEVKLTTEVLQKVESNLPKLGERIRDSLELLQGKARLNISAIDGMSELETEIKKSSSQMTRVGWGAHPLVVKDGSTVIDKITRIINFGSNLTATRSADGTVTVNASGGAGLSVLAATGSVDDSNLVFTFASAPTLVSVNGLLYADGNGCTIVATTVTLTSPVGVGGLIFGLG